MDKTLRKQFFQLGRGKQKEFREHLASAKKTDTKEKRLAKIIPLIKQGVGLNDKYRRR